MHPDHISGPYIRVEAHLVGCSYPIYWRRASSKPLVGCAADGKGNVAAGVEARIGHSRIHSIHLSRKRNERGQEK